MSTMKRTLASLAVSIGLAFAAIDAGEAAEATAPPELDWSFNGMFGTFDRASAQRGLEVYKQVCASCHGMDLLAYRSLTGIGLSAEQIEALAESHEVQTCCTEEGEPFTRPGKPADRFVSPYPNEQAARFANNGALPPDLTLINKARVGGADYVHAVLVGYEDPPPEGVSLMPGMYYNEYFPGHQIGMPPPLSDGVVTYSDGTEATVDQQARDVTTFLAWAAEPETEERRAMGVKVLLFLIVLTAFLYALKRKIWADVH
ncbi:MAG: cytochrome c1 [Rhodospirillales bacterium]|jgi:cytochrome c1|nr:cytochrome c1 [Rhodospirillales bacterium]